MNPHSTTFHRADALPDLFTPAIVDLFAGCGGMSIGIEEALVAGDYNRGIDLMVNHWETAVGVHQANHPLTEHLHASVWEVDPAKVLLGRQIAYLHLSPDCTDFSKAKGGAPKRKHIRALADVGLVWAGVRRPAVITLENVEEFQQWGPLQDDGQPDKTRRGESFRRWVSELQALGYVVEWRELRACDYGAPTTRKRLFVIARCDGKPILWPEKTHGADGYRGSSRGVAGTRSTGKTRPTARPVGSIVDRIGDERGGSRARESVGASASQGRTPRESALAPFRTAAECIDWSLPMLSIFATPAEAKAFSVTHGGGVPRRPLKPKTLQRIAGGLVKYVLGSRKPYIVNIENATWDKVGTRDVDAPLNTVTATPKGGKHAAVDVTLAPFASTLNHGGPEHRAADLRQPLATVTGANDARGLVAAQLAPYIASVDHTKTTGRGRYFDAVTDPLKTITSSNGKAVVGATLAPYTVPRYGERDGQSPRCGSVDAPAATVTGTANSAQLVAALVTKHYSGVVGSPADAPIDTITSTDHNAVTVAYLNKHRGTSTGTAADEPCPTITSGAGAARDAGAAHALGVTCAYLSHFYTSNSNGGEGDPAKPAKTITSGGQHSAVTVAMLKKDASWGEPSTGSSAEAASLAATGDARSHADGGTFNGSARCESQSELHRDPANETSASRTGTHTTAFAQPASVEASTPRTSNAAPFLIGTGGAAYAAKPKAVDEPANTVMVNDRRAIIAAFLSTYYGNSKVGHACDDPAPTVTGNDRIGVVTVTIDGETYVVTDIAMRMLTPRELARCQGFPDDYVIDRTADGKPVSKADQVKLIGNSVPPAFARAIVKANVIDCGVLDPMPRKAVAS